MKLEALAYQPGELDEAETEAFRTWSTSPSTGCASALSAREPGILRARELHHPPRFLSDTHSPVAPKPPRSSRASCRASSTVLPPPTPTPTTPPPHLPPRRSSTPPP